MTIDENLKIFLKTNILGGINLPKQVINIFFFI